MKDIEKALNLIKKQGLYPEPPALSSPHAPEVIINGKKVLLLENHGK